MAKELGKPPPPPEALLEPATNVRLGTRYLAGLLRAFPTAQAVASYNAGEDVVSVWATSFKAKEAEQFMAMIPYLETRRYVARVLYEERMYRKAYGSAGEERGGS
jgi:soluble lytic murein transglycosylase